MFRAAARFAAARFTTVISATAVAGRATLYFYAGDNKVGDRNGDGANGVWHVVKSGT